MRGVLLAAVVTVAAAIASALTPATASADVVWLCQPGMQDNPCRDSLETTYYSVEGESHVENPPLPADPPIDCFYVYPTVSEQPSRNSDKEVEAQQRAIAQYQASRFSQTCRVFAPMYRQQTLGGLAAGGSSESLQLAYSDVREAWLDYMAKHNRGRGFVLIGHSQGTRMLRALVRGEIDGNAEVRKRLVSALLLGGNVTVRKGQTAGGDFQNVPACTRSGQVGCVIAWSTFNETPPSNSRYGRVPAEDTSGFGFPAGPDFEVLCTNPASLGANDRRPLSTLLRSEPYPGILGIFLAQMYGGTQPSAPTPWLQPQDHYTGKCEQRDGANVLMLEPIGNARKLNPAPDPSWGLHLADGNIALGDLVPEVERQVKAFRGASTDQEDAVAYRLKLRVRCAGGAVRATVRGRSVRRLRKVAFGLGRGIVAKDARAPFNARLPLTPRAKRVRAIGWLRGGGHVVLRRPLRCG
jgi:hypothetical protein